MPSIVERLNLRLGVFSRLLKRTLLCRATIFRGNGAGSAADYFVGTGAWGTG